jgi:hypothetical protein
MKAKLILYLSFTFVNVCLLNSCFTNYIYESLSPKPLNNEITEISETYLDTNNNLIVNFKGKMFGAQNEKKYNFSIDLDSLVDKINSYSDDYYYYYNEADIKVQSFRLEDYDSLRLSFVNVGLSKESIKKNWNELIDRKYILDTNNTEINIYSKYYLVKDGFLYNNVDSFFINSNYYNKFFFEFELDYKRHYLNAFYFPVALILDIITFPIQLFLLLVYFMIFGYI